MHVIPIKAFTDNYIWCAETKSQCVLVDPGDAAPVLAYLQKSKLSLSAILITHHHADHIGGVPDLLEKFPVPVYAPASGSYLFEHTPCADGDEIDVPGMDGLLQVMEIPGHTLDHIAYLGDGFVFCGDTLFAGGCGRIFEGTSSMMKASLDRLSALPPETIVYCTHEYTLANLAFAQHVDPSNVQLQKRLVVEQKKRDQGLPTLPTTIALEHATNPFLRAGALSPTDEMTQRYPGINWSDPVASFGAVRDMKDNF